MHQDPAFPQAIDLDHLERQTFGDNLLACELLGLLAQQCTLLCPAIRGEVPGTSPADAAHTLKGGALGVGALHLAVVTERIEASLEQGGPEVPGPLCRELDEAV